MNMAERRAALIKIICRRGHETIPNLAREFGTSERTILRDIEVLSLTEPIYTKTGRYLGGVYIMNGYSPYKLYLKDNEINLIRKIVEEAERDGVCHLEESDIVIAKNLLTTYSKPKTQKTKERKKQ